MKSVLVCYESQYGYSQKYAQWIAKELGGRALPVSQAGERDIQDADLVVVGGGLYAGKVGGASFVKRKEAVLKGKLAALFTVGLSPTDKEEVFSPLMEKNFAPQILANVKVYHLRGGMDYQKLKWMHRMMMKMLVHMLRKKAPSERTRDDQGLLDSYGKAEDFSDPASVAPLVAYVKSLR